MTRYGIDASRRPFGAYLIDSDIPHGAGVSSSAALIVAVLQAAASAAKIKVSSKDIARWAQAVERDDIGMPCGIMDQMAVCMGRLGWALALDTRTLETEQVALPASVAFPVFHSGITRTLADGQYADRRRACEKAGQQLRLNALSLADDAQFARLAELEPVIRKRARHAIMEHRRVLRAIAALKVADVADFGQCMTESHHSMRDDFEIVPAEMDEMVGHALDLGALGSRLTGGGFGGCFVSCVPLAQLDRFLEQMPARFPQIRLISTLDPSNMAASPAPGARYLA